MSHYRIFTSCVTKKLFDIKSFLRGSPSLKKGQAMITAVIFFLFISAAVVFGVASTLLSEMKTARVLSDSKNSFYTAEAGIESTALRAKKGYALNAIEIVPIGSASSSILVDEPSADDKTLTAKAIINYATRAVEARMTRSTGVSFFYGTQSGNGGLVLENNSSITGNVFSNGTVVGTGSNLISGSVISAGSGGRVESVHATGTVYAHTIRNAIVDGDAHYQSISNSTVWGALYPGSSDKDVIAFPIADAVIAGWESLAATTVINSPCPYTIQSDTTIGPAKITCDLKIKGSPTVTLGGPLWVSGNIEIENNSIIQIDPSLAGKSIAIIADNKANQLTSSSISLGNNPQFAGSGNGSYIILISQNKSAEQGGTEKAIEIENNALGDFLVYASHGEIFLQNNAVLKEATGFRMRLKNNANVVFEKGLESLVFSSGAGGTWYQNGWAER